MSLSQALSRAVHSPLPAGTWAYSKITVMLCKAWVTVMNNYGRRSLFSTFYETKRYSYFSMSIFFKLSSTVTVHKIRPSGPGPAAGGTWAEILACLGRGCCQRGRDVGGWSRGNHKHTESLWWDPGLLSMVLGSAFQSATFWNILLAWVSFWEPQIWISKFSMFVLQHC